MTLDDLDLTHFEEKYAFPCWYPCIIRVSNCGAISLIVSQEMQNNILYNENQYPMNFNKNIHVKMYLYNLTYAEGNKCA